MCVVSKSLPASRTHAVRSWAWVACSHPGLHLGTLTISQGRNTKDTKSYFVREVCPNGLPGRMFVLTKRAAGDEDGGVYTVFLGADGESCFCNCDGWSRVGTCKHVDSGWDMLREGVLDVEDADRGRDVYPSTSQLAEDIGFDVPACFRGESKPF